MSDSFLTVYLTFPNKEEAQRIGRILLENKLAACINILGPCESIYRWNGVIEEDQEIAAIVKTTSAIYPELQKTVIKEHPYDVPCITAYKIEQGNPDYLQWLSQETKEL